MVLLGTPGLPSGGTACVRWAVEASTWLAHHKSATNAGGTAGSQAQQPRPVPAGAKRWSKHRPFPGTIVAIEGLCTVRAADDKATVRVEIDLADSRLTYSPGDALGIYPRNCPEVTADSALSFLFWNV